MNELVISVKTVCGQAWRFTFANLEPDADLPDGIVIREPRQVSVTGQPLEIESVLADTGEGDGGEESLTIVWLPTGDMAPPDLEKRLLQWIDEGSPDRTPVKANLRTVHAIWANGRALVYAAPDQWPDASDAVIRFSLMANATLALEREITTIWSGVDTHLPLRHAVTFREERQQTKVDQMTELITRMRVSFLQIMSAIEQTDPRLNGTSKRLCAELILAAGIFDRLDVMEDPIIFALEHYELANTRLIEYRNAAREMFLTGLIVITLLVQTAVILVQELR
jgi:hypothetical protein